MRSENPSPKSLSARGSTGALLDAPEDLYAPKPRRVRAPEPAPHRDLSEDFAHRLPNPTEDDDFDYRRQRACYQIKFRGRVIQVPKTLWGRIGGACALLVLAGCFAAGYLALRGFFLHDPRFTIESSSAIQIVGNTHLTRAQLLSVFGEDVERNIFNVPLAARRAELESLPWVEHATIMRLLPDHLRIAIVERTPIAFVRQGSQIGMVDAGGVLLDMPTDAPGDPHYSFPVVTGISFGDPLSTRAARMRIYRQFTAELDSTGEHISEKLSEVDLSNPEDVKALIPDGDGGSATDILVHFGDADFLARYQKYQQHLQEWRTQYPKLGSVDMRYERQVVLEMQPGAHPPDPLVSGSQVSGPQASGPQGSGSQTGLAARPQLGPAPSATHAALKPPAKSSTSTAASADAPAPAKSAAKPAPHAATKPAPDAAPKSSPVAPGEWHMVVVKPHPKQATTPSQAAPR